MLSTCFNNLFVQLQLHRVNLDTLLQLWLTLNDDSPPDENNQATFDPSRIPPVALSQASVTSLLATLAWTPNIPVRTWVLAFQTLTLLANLRHQDVGSGNMKWLATVIVSDINLMPVLIKFLSSTSAQGPVMSSQQFTQVTTSFYIRPEKLFASCNLILTSFYIKKSLP